VARYRYRDGLRPPLTPETSTAPNRRTARAGPAPAPLARGTQDRTNYKITITESLQFQGIAEVDRENWCDLEAGHIGLHYALGQESLDEAWWLRWNDEDGLPSGHAGAHSFEYDRTD